VKPFCVWDGDISGVYVAVGDYSGYQTAEPAGFGTLPAGYTTHSNHEINSQYLYAQTAQPR